VRIVLFLFVFLFSSAAALCAQDPFEIHVYEYEPLHPWTFTYEAHVNYIAKGAEGFHFASEVTAGVTDDLRAALVLLTAKRYDGPYEYAGFRVLPHIYAPKRWHLPLNLGLVAEFSFAKPAYVDDPCQVELRSIVEKHIGRLQLDANPVVSRGGLEGPSFVGIHTAQGSRIGWQLSRTFTPSLEYYSSWTSDPIHQVFAGGDLRVAKNVTWSFGAGFGLTPASNGLTLKSHLQFEIGGRKTD
jgi:hypothetical protein